MPDLEALFAATLQGDYEDDAPWHAVQVLRTIATRPVFEIAAQWTESADPLVRTRGIDVIAQLGHTKDHPANSFPEESYDVVVKALQQERELRPLDSAIIALSYIGDTRAVPLIAQFHSHPAEDIRYSVAFALGSFPNDPLSVQTLLTLMKDAESDVRDWATFSLGVKGTHDSPEVRDALYQCLHDPDEDVREEALVGLARRNDPRTLPVLIDLLRQTEGTYRGVEAARSLLKLDENLEDWENEDYLTALKRRFPLPDLSTP